MARAQSFWSMVLGFFVSLENWWIFCCCCCWGGGEGGKVGEREEVSRGKEEEVEIEGKKGQGAPRVDRIEF